MTIVSGYPDPTLSGAAHAVGWLRVRRRGARPVNPSWRPAEDRIRSWRGCHWGYRGTAHLGKQPEACQTRASTAPNSTWQFCLDAVPHCALGMKWQGEYPAEGGVRLRSVCDDGPGRAGGWPSVPVRAVLLRGGRVPPLRPRGIYCGSGCAGQGASPDAPEGRQTLSKHRGGPRIPDSLAAWISLARVAATPPVCRRSEALHGPRPGFVRRGPSGAARCYSNRSTVAARPVFHCRSRRRSCRRTHTSATATAAQ